MTDRAKQIRLDTLKLARANRGYHYGGCFSAVEIFVALFDSILKDADEFILSKGHACWPYYVLLRERGLDPKLECEPHRDTVNGISASTGSLGHGLPIGIGMAMARMQKGDNSRVFILMGDGECQEGTTWESLLIAGHYKLKNLTVIVDANGIQGSGMVGDILPVKNTLRIAAHSAGWACTEIDGHDENELKRTLNYFPDKPRLIIANTTKGKGVSYMENEPKWHACWPNDEQYAQAVEELS